MNNEKLKHFKEGLNQFAKAVVFGSLNELKKQKKGNSKLARSIMYKDHVMQNSIALDFIMNDYGIFHDKGVKGKNPNALSKYAKYYGVQKAPNSPYKFGSGKSKGKIGDGILGFIKRKKFQFQHPKKIRNSKGDEVSNPKAGQFMSFKTMSYIISRSIYLSCIKPSLFFTKPFEAAFKKLPDNLAEDFALDLENFIEFTTKDFNKKF